MRLLLCSHRFHPDIGGIESVSMMLATAFAKAGHQVVVVTQTEGEQDKNWPFKVERRPRAVQLMRLVRNAQVVFHNHLSLQVAWPLLLIRRPWMVTLQTWLPRRGIAARLKRFSLRFARRLYISQAIGRDMALPGEVIGNPYNSDVFRLSAVEPKSRALIFVGRLVSDKGADLLLEALVLLRNQGIRPSLTLVGSGPEELALRTQATDLALEDQVDFAGMHSGPGLAKLLQQHRVMVVPSRWPEPFGIVALEGLACGCAIVASDQGGLPEAAGSCGSTFPNGNAEALAQRIKEQLDHPPICPSEAAAHLSRFTVERVTATYLERLEALARN